MDFSVEHLDSLVYILYTFHYFNNNLNTSSTRLLKFYPKQALYKLSTLYPVTQTLYLNKTHVLM